MNKHYYSLDEFYKNKFGSKVFKVSINSGLSCPNKDGSKGLGGCIFCNGTPYVGDSSLDVITQFNQIKDMLHKKWPNAKYIPFLEANTNTYASLEVLKSIYEPLLEIDGVVGLDIATRCDSISEEVYDYLEELNKRTFLTIELGLQSMHEDTLKLINRHHTRDEFTTCVHELKRRNINVVAHIINGLPYETEDMMIDTIRYVNSLKVDGIKFHMLYIEHGTKLENMFLNKPFHILTEDEYISILGKQIAILDKNIVVHRIISGPDLKKLVEPKWLVGKFRILNKIDQYLIDNDIYQGKNCG